jgi:hypothetical protein
VQVQSNYWCLPFNLSERSVFLKKLILFNRLGRAVIVRLKILLLFFEASARCSILNPVLYPLHLNFHGLKSGLTVDVFLKSLEDLNLLTSKRFDRKFIHKIFKIKKTMRMNFNSENQSGMAIMRGMKKKVFVTRAFPGQSFDYKFGILCILHPRLIIL